MIRVHSDFPEAEAGAVDDPHLTFAEHPVQQDVHAQGVAGDMPGYDNIDMIFF